MWEVEERNYDEAMWAFVQQKLDFRQSMDDTMLPA